MVKKMLTKNRLCRLMTCQKSKGNLKIVKIYMKKFNVSILNRLEFFVNTK